MREPLRDKERLEHMLEAIHLALQFSQGIGYEEMKQDKMRFFAIVKNMEIIGEASYMLSLPFKEMHPNTEWRAIEAMRHYLVHGYYQIGAGQLWNTLQNDLEPLKEQVETYLKELN